MVSNLERSVRSLPTRHYDPYEWNELVDDVVNYGPVLSLTAIPGLAMRATPLGRLVHTAGMIAMFGYHMIPESARTRLRNSARNFQFELPDYRM